MLPSNSGADQSGVVSRLLLSAPTGISTHHHHFVTAEFIPPNFLAEAVERAVLDAPVYDIHTHLYAPAFGDLLLWGIDDLLVYHYLVAEGFRHWDLPYEDFWRLDKTTQADLIWTTLFVQHSPLSEACRGVLTTLHALGLDVKERDLPKLRQWFAGHHLEGHMLRVMDSGWSADDLHDEFALR